MKFCLAEGNWDCGCGSCAAVQSRQTEVKGFMAEAVHQMKTDWMMMSTC